MTFEKAVLVVAVAALITFLTRAFSFIVFGMKGEPSPVIKYLGTYLPSAVIAVLIIYCLKGVRAFDYESTVVFVKQLSAVILVAVLHIWKRNNLISIGVGTIAYMAMLQLL